MHVIQIKSRFSNPGKRFILLDEECEECRMIRGEPFNFHDTKKTNKKKEKRNCYK